MLSDIERNIIYSAILVQKLQQFYFLVDPDYEIGRIEIIKRNFLSQ